MRKRTGLRNKFRSGKSSYSVREKGKRADRYGRFLDGKLRSSETIAGRSITTQLPMMGGGKL